MDILKDIRKENKLTQQELAELFNKKYNVNINKSMVSKWENGVNTPSNTFLGLYAKEFGINMNYLIGISDEKYIDDYSEYKNLIKVPIFNKKVPLLGTIAAGTPILADENVEMYVDLDRTVSADFCLRVKGDSMINAKIDDGDVVFIKKQSDVDDGEIAAVLIDDEATLKRVYKMAGKVVLRAENPKYKPIELNGKENVIILGKATYSLKKIL